MRLNGWVRAAIVAVMMDEARAEAATTFSPPVRNAEGDVLTCLAQNFSDDPVEVAAVLRDETGAALGSFSTQVGVGHTQALTTSSDPVAGGYCEFEFDADPAAVRGLIHLTPAAGGDSRLLYEATGVAGIVATGVVTRSPPLQGGPADLVACIVQNLDSASVAMTAQLRDSSGVLLASNAVVVGAGDVATLVSATGPATPTACSFIFDGNPAEIRGYIRISGAMGGNARLVAAAAPLGGASTTILYTPAVVPKGGVARCLAHNVGGGTVLVDADLVDASGAVVVDAAAEMVETGHIEVLASSTAASASPVSCRFTFAASQNALRGYLTFNEVVGGGTRLLLAGSPTGGIAGEDATTFTAALRNLEGSDLECWTQNLGGAPVDVAAALIDNTGDVVDAVQMTIAAGHTVRLVQNSDDLIGAYCRFVFDGSPADVRGFIVLNDGTTRLLQSASIAAPLTPLPTATATLTSTPTPTPLPSDTRTPTATPVFTDSPTATRTPTATSSTTPTSTASAAATPTATPIDSPTATRTPTATSSTTPTSTAVAAATPTATPIDTTAATHTATVAAATASPTVSAPATATASPLQTSSASPTEAMSAPTDTPTPLPTQTQTPEEAGTATATAISSPTTSPAPARRGDANCDGSVSAADLIAAIGIIESGVAPGCGEDANGDGAVDAADVKEIWSLIFL